MKDTFSLIHPIVNFIFFAFVIAFSMFITNPICLAISLISGLINALYLNGKKIVRLCLLYLLPMVCLVAVINPVFNHAGVTLLYYFPWGNPLTLESILYGISAAVLLSSVILWFSCFNAIITSDKFVYLFGRIIPSLSLVLSVALRFVPQFTARMKLVRNSQKCIGRDFSNGSVISKIKNGINILSIMISWSLESSIETADSMKSRGHGLKGRTAFSIYKFDKRSCAVLLIVLFAGIAISIMYLSGLMSFSYFPSIKGNLFQPYSFIFYILYAGLMNLPLIINIWEGIKWKRLRSAI